jgi:16S rRNA (guanine1207-N2)-methyltransferase
MNDWRLPGLELRLGRFPYDTDQSNLQAWNGADSLLAEHLAAVSAGATRRVLVLNDAFGALACAASSAGHEVNSQSDSWLARLATAENLRRNGLDPAAVHFIDSLALPAGPEWQPDLVLMHLPKSQLMLEFQLGRLAACLAPGTELAAGGMTRDVHNATSAAFEAAIGPARTSLAAHKARLVHAKLSPEAAARARTASAPGGAGTGPRWQLVAEAGLPALELAHHAGVYGASAGRPDQGSLLLLRCLATAPWLAEACAGNRFAIVDCGCGDGLLALAAARLFPATRLVCADESFIAVASARAGFARAGLEERTRFLWTDCLEGLPSASAGLVLCNPPFHQGQGQTLAIAKRMFAEARRCLVPGGLLLAVANRHLGHHRTLEIWFQDLRVEADDGRFVVISGVAEDRPGRAGGGDGAGQRGRVAPAGRRGPG